MTGTEDVFLISYRISMCPKYLRTLICSRRRKLTTYPNWGICNPTWTMWRRCPKETAPRYSGCTKTQTLTTSRRSPKEWWPPYCLSSRECSPVHLGSPQIR